MDKFITLDEENHTYFDKYGNKYASVSSLMRALMPKFANRPIAAAVAKRDGITVEEVLAQWEQKKNNAIDHGNRIHNSVKKYLNNDSVDDIQMFPFLKKFKNEFYEYGVLKCEKDIVYSTDHLVAGTPDIEGYRSKKVIDIFDIKTNLERGIQFFDKYGKYMKEPVSHLEACNYNEHCLQISLYGLLAEMSQKYKIGGLGIYFIKDHHKGEWDYIPVPYLKKEAEAILENHIEVNNVQPVKPYVIAAFN